jgi:phage terminase large subunit
MSRVRGQFSDQSHKALVKLAWLERAKRRAQENPVVDTGGRLVAGVDVGGVVSETVVYLCEIAKGNPKILKFGAWRGDDTRGHAVAFLKPYRDRLATVRVDADGTGYNFGLCLRDQGLPVDLAHVGIPVESKPNLRADDPALRFFNQKAQLYQRVADLLEHDGLDGLTDDTTIGQLAGILYETDPRGRTMIESKEKARQRGVQSPDRAEALMLALGKPPEVFEWHSVRELEDPKSPFYNGSDDDDYPGRGRRWDGFVGKLRFPNKGAW